MSQQRVAACQVRVEPSKAPSIMGARPVSNIFPSNNIIWVFWWAIKEFEQDPVVEHAKLDSCITSDGHDLAIESDRLLVFPHFVNNVLKSILQIKCIVLLVPAHVHPPAAPVYQLAVEQARFAPARPAGVSQRGDCRDSIRRIESWEQSYLSVSHCERRPEMNRGAFAFLAIKNCKDLSRRRASRLANPTLLSVVPSLPFRRHSHSNNSGQECFVCREIYRSPNWALFTSRPF